jgi:hypothetical protein
MDKCLAFNGSYSKLVVGSNMSMFTNGCNASIVMNGATMSNTANVIVNNSETWFNSNISTLRGIRMCYSNFNDAHWEIFLDNPGTASASDIVFKSKNGTRISWTDDFFPEILNFTGKHRCSWSGEEDESNYIGMIVSATGVYKNLDDILKIDIDEAIPVVELSTEEYDSRAFGVISGFETKNEIRKYRIGNLQFAKAKVGKDCKVIVNSLGEGAIWVVNSSGNFKNGDLITTSGIAGYGMKQKSKTVKSYTVGKITCDCKFSLTSPLYRCEEFAAFGKVFKRALVGCSYKF